MRFFCDEMLTGVGRWLRAAGYDTRIAETGTADEAILLAVEAEERLLLTCDRRLAARADGAAVLLPSEAPEGAAPELRRRLGVDWLKAPFTRCLMDNAPLHPARAHEHAALPEPARDRPGPIMACDVCCRLYWPGSHVRRMRAKLESWHNE